jgi:hypothetical protein
MAAAPRRSTVGFELPSAETLARLRADSRDYWPLLQE